MQEVSLKQLLDAGAHFGHRTRRWNPKMKQYIYGSEGLVHIFDLLITKKAIEDALLVLEDMASKNKSIMFVGTKKQAKAKTIEVAKNTGSYYISERWLGGTLTNLDQMLKTLRKLDDMKEEKETDAFNKYTKKEKLLFERKINRIERFFSGIIGIKKLPDCLVVVDAKRERGALKEAKMTGLTTIALVDTNSDPEGIDYVIPMNDDATKAINYVLELMEEAIANGKKAQTKKSTKKEGKPKKKK